MVSFIFCFVRWIPQQPNSSFDVLTLVGHTPCVAQLSLLALLLWPSNSGSLQPLTFIEGARPQPSLSSTEPGSNPSHLSKGPDLQPSLLSKGPGPKPSLLSTGPGPQTPHFYWPTPHFYWPDPSLLLARPLTSISQASALCRTVPCQVGLCRRVGLTLAHP